MITLNTPASDFDDQMDALPAAGSEEGASGFIENMITAAGQTWREDLSISSMVPTDEEEKRKARIWEYYRDGKISEGTMMYYGNDYNGIAKEARHKNGIMDLPFDEEMDELNKAEYGRKRQDAQDVMERANPMGVFGAIVGGSAPIFLDPLLAPSYFMGYGEAAAGAKFLNVAKTALAVEATIEAVRQPLIMSHKDRIGADYGFKEAAQNVALAAGMGALGSMTALAFTKGVNKFRKHLDLSNPLVKHSNDALRVLEEDLAKAPKGTNAEDFINKSEETTNSFQNRGPLRGADPGADEALQVETDKFIDDYMAGNPEATITEDVVDTVTGKTITKQVSMSEYVERMDDLDNQIEIAIRCRYARS